MANDESHGGGADPEAHTVPGGGSDGGDGGADPKAQTVRGGGFWHGDRLTSLPTCDLDSLETDALEDDRDVALMRAVAHAPPRRPPNAVVPGTRWGGSGRYIIDRRLGRGGMGTVYAASDAVLKRIVALKILDVAGADHDPAHHARLLREAQLAASMEHERIARVYDCGSHEGYAFVAMEYVPGGTLRQRMAHGDIPLPQIIDIVTQIAEGLAELHAKGVVHRDLKPENVMMTAQGGVKLVDFGLARHAVLHDGEPGLPVRSGRSQVVDSASTAASSGTPGYMAPEQCNGDAMDARVDIFALGVILYELIAHDKPFRGATVGAIVNATLETVPSFHEPGWALVPGRLLEHTARMLKRDPEARFADGTAALAALRELAAGLSGERTADSEALAAVARARTERPARSPIFVDVGMATRGLELPVAIGALLCLGLQATQPMVRRPPAPPPGMALIDVGEIELGQTPFDLERICHEMGDPCEREYLYREAPRFRISLPPFLLDRHEVTNLEFARYLDQIRSSIKVVADQDTHEPRFARLGAGDESTLLADLDRDYSGVVFDGRRFMARTSYEYLPVVQVTWYAAEMYCAFKRARLPTENEWEAAARGRDDRRFPWGNALPRCGEVALANDNWIPGRQACAKPSLIQSVGTMPQDLTADGVSDLGGNVSEWTSTIFVAGNRAARPVSGPRDAGRVTRGGAWTSSLLARTSGRHIVPPGAVGTNLGFRCASDPDDARP